jgi:hypothetical protein
MGTSSVHLSNPAIPRGIAIPGSFTEEDKVNNLIGGTWAKDDIPGLEEDCNDLEQILVAETADMEALELRSLAEARRHPEWVQWKHAIEEEMAMLKAASTWHLEEPPPGANVIGSKCHHQATVSCRFQFGFCILMPVRLVPLRTYRLK